METREELLNRAKVLVFPTIPDADEFHYHENLLKDKEHIILDYRGTDDRYYHYEINNHHFTTKYHREVVLPALENLLHFGYDINDFYLIENKKVISNEEMDFSYMHPKKDMEFILEYDKIVKEGNGVITPYHMTELRTFGEISTVGEIVNNQYFNESVTKSHYHKMYVAPHQCSRLTNDTINSDKSLFVSCDSQLIPDIPILACYYKKVYIFDNRQTLRQFYLVENDPNPTDVLIQCWCTADDNLYTEQNLQ